VDLHRPVFNFLAKGTLFVLLYAGFLWLMDMNFRKLMSSGAALLRARLSGSPVKPVASAAAPTEESSWKTVSGEVESSVDSLPAGR
jgi:hypothetical protein